ncbi:ABC transporter ATP-binding protein [Leifsonia flava]|uniref:ATP-binding cassette domain-containing protein n=1 Tax=Orlajensenia leifsoniae TaxID=2561933 RepID=A0A4Y9QUY9_9MICO|nr:ATP-binding cassette domain-containing protein [Leifsonia flava]TFV96401.1 ATP-binding cassette domain-containing protein [Leifsonia flava]
MTAPAIQVRGVRKSYGDATVLDGVDLSIETGSIVALLGPNGAGKTTLINVLATLTGADSGTVVVAGADLATDPEAVREAISLTGQYAAVDEVLTGEENLRMLARLSGFTSAGARQRASELLDRFDLTDAARRRVGSYSGGMRRRLDLALGLVADPPVVFLDEPTTGLDTRSRQELWRMIAELAERGTTILLTTQYLEEADALADRILVLDGGTIVAEGTPTELKARVGGEVVELRDLDDSLLLELPTDGTVAGLEAALAVIAADPASATLRIVVRKPSMDDVFLALTGHRVATDAEDPTSTADRTDNREEVAA